MSEFPSKLMEEAVNAFAGLPGIGRKTALRLVLHLIKQDTKKSEDFGEAVIKMRREIKFCSVCHNISDLSVCNICTSLHRDRSLVCVVETIRDVIAIENTGQYKGLYHVLGGVISPMEGISPNELTIDSLIHRIQTTEIKELIMAISPTIEGDTTLFYITKKIGDTNVKVTSLARGISFGGELEYADEITLARAIATRRPYETE